MKNENLKLKYYYNPVSTVSPAGDFQIKMDNESETPFLMAPLPMGATFEDAVQIRVQRVVDCVNALSGIENPLKMRQTWEVVKELKLDDYHKMKQERDDLVDLFKDLNNCWACGESIGPKSILVKSLSIYIHKLNLNGN